MSITFYIGMESEDGSIRPAERCDCSTRWMDECDAADARGDEWPESYSCEVCLAEINLANGNALDLLAWLGLPVDYCGHVPARELAPVVRRRLWDVERNSDPALTPADRAEMFGVELGGRVHFAGRRPGYLREQCERLLATCERAGDRLIVWA